MKKYFFISILFLSVFLYSQEKYNSKPNDYLIYTNKVIFDKVIIVSYQPNIINSDFGIFSVYPDFRIFPSNMNQSTISSAINLANPNLIFAGANTDLGQGYYYSTNGGITWNGDDFLPGSLLISSNPSVQFAYNGTLFFNYLDNSLVVDRSSNNGVNWLGRNVIPTSGGFDKNHIAVDIDTNSPYYARLYTGYTKWSPPYPIMIAYSTNYGLSYSAEIQVGSPQTNHYEQGVNIQTANGGTVYAVWATPNISNSNIEDKIGFSKSVNGGVNWTVPVLPLTINGIRGTLLSSNIRVNSFPSMSVDKSGGIRNGYIYLCWAQRNLSPAGNDADIIFSFSSDGGTSFSNPIRINNDPLNNVKQQFSPSITVDPANCNLIIVFYDSRDVSTSDSCNTYLAFSADGGINWSNFKISSSPQRPVPIQGYAPGYFSDYISVSAHNGNIFPFWTDNRSGKAQIYSAIITLGPVIVHDSIRDTENLTGPYTVNSKIITTGSNIDPTNTKIFWGRGGITDSISMINSSGNNWTGNIPGNGTAFEYRYYIKASDIASRISTLPVNAPSGYLSFLAGSDIIKPVIIHSPLPDTPKPAWPVLIKTTVTDNIGVDSVWIKWYINNSTQGIRHLRLNGTGYLFSANFNSTINEVNAGDSIFYKIFASDISSNHNVDSTVLYKFKLTNQATIFVGNGTLVSPYPFSTFYTDARTQFIYPASELTAAGGAKGDILRIGFNIAASSPVVINSLNVKFQHTQATNLSGFINSNWYITYIGNYTVSGNGWQYIDFTSPFQWNGSSNLLIELCYDNSYFGQNSSVYSSNAPGTVWHQRQDLTSGSGCIDLNNGSVQNLRPNISMTINYIVGIKNISSKIPNGFNLYQNYPNPFNPVTKIKFEIPKSGFTKLFVYDLLGRKISVLVNENLNPGIYETTFDATHYSSGVYFYKLETDGFVQTRKLVLLK